MIPAWLSRRRNAYRACFLNEHGELTANGERVLRDLARFCGAHRSNFSPDPQTTAFREGRREVFLRIAEPLRLTEAHYRTFMESEPNND